MRIEGPETGKAAECEPILRSLPDWFGIEEAIVEYVRDIDVMPTFVASVDGNVVGFVTVKHHFEHTAELHVMGIRPEYHRHGIGRALVRHIEAWLCDDGIEYLQVKTLSASRPCEFYDRTRAFYLAMGFRPLEEFKTLWDERNPCLLLIKKLSDTP